MEQDKYNFRVNRKEQRQHEGGCLGDFLLFILMEQTKKCKKKYNNQEEWN